VGYDAVVSEHGYAGAFLSPMLKGIEAEIGEFGSLGMLVDTEQTAGFSGVIIVMHIVSQPVIYFKIVRIYSSP